VSEHVDIGAYAARFRGRMSTFKRGVLIKLFGAVIKDTPVLTGRLRANWRFGKGSPPTGTSNSTTDSTPRVTNDVRQQVNENDETYYLANNLPYVNRIEYHGWSRKKAPDGMVRRNVVRIAGLLREEAAKHS
jgi:hypothetical protein